MMPESERPDVMTKISDILDERGARYGDFPEVALVAQNIKAAMRHSKNWHHLPAHSKEALEMLANKLARILNGDSAYVDSWRDAEGYVKLVADRLQRTSQSITGE
jgi:hypothetical protein